MQERCLRLCAVLVGLSCGQMALPGGERLAADPRVVAGQLPNGLGWVWRAHANPPGQVALMLQVRVGSLHENEDQRGFAHLLVHLAFGGSENFTPERLAAWLENLGMEAGPDVNAVATFDQTTYTLVLPDNRAETVETALTLLSDIAFGLLISPERVEADRSVVLTELREGRSVEQRLQDELFSRLFSSSRFGQRLPMGSAEALRGATAAAVAAFYRTWYRPKNMTLLVVGDLPLEALRPLVEKWFGRYRAEGKMPPAAGPEFVPFQQQRAIVLSDPEYRQTDVAVVNLRPGRPPATTVDLTRQELIEQLAARALLRRLNLRLRRDQASYRSANAEIMPFYGQAVLASASVTGQRGDWEKLLFELLDEISRTHQYGFADHELAVLKAELLAGTRRAVALEPRRSAEDLLAEIAERHLAGEPVLSAQQQLELLERLLPTINAADLQQALVRQLDPESCAFVVQMPQQVGLVVPGTFEVLAAARAALARRPEPLPLDPPIDRLLADLPAAGHVVQETRDVELGIVSMRLDNGVRVHCRRMDGQADAAMVSLSLAGGRIEETAENAGVTEAAIQVFHQPAAKQLTSTQIADLLIGRQISIEAEAGEDAVIVRVNTTASDLETSLQLLHLLLTEGRLESSALRNWKQETLEKIDLYRRYPEYHATTLLRELAGNGDPRLLAPTAERIDRQTVGAAQGWFERLCREAPLEVAVVGDVDPDRVRSLVEIYFGSLPARPADAGRLDGLRSVSRPPGPYVREVRVEAEVPAARVLVGFFGCDAREVDAARHLQLAAAILDRELGRSLRQHKWLHSLEVQNLPSLAYPDCGLFVVGASCEPGQVNQVSSEITAALDRLRDSGPPEEALEDARQQILRELNELMSDPEYWCDVLQTHDLHGVQLNRIRTIREDLSKYTAEQLRQTFRRYYVASRSFRVTVLPAAAESGPTGSKP
jgi:zinc protease